MKEFVQALLLINLLIFPQGVRTERSRTLFDEREKA